MRDEREWKGEAHFEGGYMEVESEGCSFFAEVLAHRLSHAYSGAAPPQSIPVFFPTELSMILQLPICLFENEI